jgi:hypothetical protein
MTQKEETGISDEAALEEREFMRHAEHDPLNEHKTRKEHSGLSDEAAEEEREFLQEAGRAQGGKPRETDLLLLQSATTDRPGTVECVGDKGSVGMDEGLLPSWGMNDA